MKHSRRKGFQVIHDRLAYGRKAPWQASRRERKRGRDLTWTLRGMPAPEWVTENWPSSATILAVRFKGLRHGKAIDVDAVGCPPTMKLAGGDTKTGPPDGVLMGA